MRASTLSTIFVLMLVLLAGCNDNPVPVFEGPAPAPSTKTAMPAPQPTVEANSPDPDRTPDGSQGDADTAETAVSGEASPKNLTTLPALAGRDCLLYIPQGDVAGETIQCGFVVVPAERGNPESKAVKLAFVILKATGNDPAAEPIVHVSGGPGINATSRSTVVELARRYAPFRDKRDIVLYDQRGVGHSEPTLDCASFAALNSSADTDSNSSTYEQCQADMRAAGYPPEAFTTAVSAADLVDLMHALDYPGYNLYGISYGTRLLMSLLHHFPDEPLIRAVILDSVDTLPEDVGNEYIATTPLLQLALFEEVFNVCAGDLTCAADYPDLRKRFAALTEQLAAEPLLLDEFTTIDGDTLHRHFFPYDPAVQHIPYQPRLISELERGVTTTLQLLRTGGVPDPTYRQAYLPPEPPAGSDLLDLFLNCSDSASDDEDTAAFIALWDAGLEAIERYLQDACDPDTTNAALALIEGNPGLFNYVIGRFAPDEIQGVTPNYNNKLNCTEQYPFREPFDAIDDALRTARMPAFFIEKNRTDMEQTAAGCDAWNDQLAVPTPQTYGEQPVLILNGQFDPLTPPAWAETAVAAIPRAQYVVIPNAWHSILGNNGPCPTGIALQFLADPTAAVAAGCTDDMAISFLPPAPGENTAAGELAGSPGAAGLDDPLYPKLGNGGYDVQHYDLTLDVEPDMNMISGTVVIAAVATQALSTFNLDLLGLTVDRIQVNGRAASYSREAHELIITPEAGLAATDTFLVEVTYHGQPQPVTDPGVPIPLGWQEQAGGSFVVSEPSGAMNWYPNNNHPTDKATYTFRVRVPDPFEVAANGTLSETVTESGRTSFIWQVNQPLATYLATVQINDYEIIEEMSEGGIPIRNVFLADTPEEVRDAFNSTGPMLDYLSELIAPYPFDNYGVVLLRQPTGWALETQTLSTFGQDGPSRSTVVMHELVHSWFGNSVSPATWQDVWLNEGFAKYFESLWLDHVGGEPIDSSMAEVYQFIDSQAAGPPALPEQSELFGLDTYFRGAYTLHALRRTVGDELFFDILREYYRRYAGSNASTQAFIDVARELGGEEADAILNEWLYMSDLPDPAP